jgi:hypothetical protein
MALSKIDAANFLTGTIPDTNINNASLDNVTGLPAGVGGKVLQVVSAHTATIVSSTSNTYVDSGLTASITPSSSSNKVIVVVNQSFAKLDADTWGNVKVLRGSTDIGGDTPARGLLYTGGTDQIYGGMCFNYNFQDSPSSTSSVTYKTQFNNNEGTGSFRAQPDSSQSYMLLMEVAG